MLINRIEFLKDYIIEIFFQNNYTFFYDFKPQLNTIRFRNIRSYDIFSKGKLIDGCRIVWDNDTSLTDYEIFGFEIYESNLYVHSKDKCNLSLAEA